jgi:hypothetical protein
MSAKKGLNLTLKIWRQKNNKSKGQFETYKISDVSTDSSFLEMLDMLNEQLVNTYRGAPKTINKAYKIASKALQENEEFTFSNEEIDKFLPASLRKL